jgi:hypothetical protein
MIKARPGRTGRAFFMSTIVGTRWAHRGSRASDRPCPGRARRAEGAQAARGRSPAGRPTGAVLTRRRAVCRPRAVYAAWTGGPFGTGDGGWRAPPQTMMFAVKTDRAAAPHPNLQLTRAVTSPGAVIVLFRSADLTVPSPPEKRRLLWGRLPLGSGPFGPRGLAEGTRPAERTPVVAEPHTGRTAPSRPHRFFAVRLQRWALNRQLSVRDSKSTTGQRTILEQLIDGIGRGLQTSPR